MKIRPLIEHFTPIATHVTSARLNRPSVWDYGVVPPAGLNYNGESAWLYCATFLD